MSFDTERFILEIQNRPCLWDSTTKEYSDRHTRLKCWDEIVDLFKEKDEMKEHEIRELSDSLQKRWKSIRGCYTREIGRQKLVKSGSGCQARKSEYIYFQQLQFLQKVITVRDPNPVTDFDTPAVPEDDSEKEDEFVEEHIDASNCEGRKRKKKQKDEFNQLIAVLNKSLAHREDEDRLFLMSLVDALKKVPSHRKLTAKIRIMSVIDEETNIY